MALFKIGQRVKVIRAYPNGFNEILVATATVYELKGNGMHYDITIKTDGVFPYSPGNYDTVWYVWTWMLEPLSDPKADAFIEGIKKMRPVEDPQRLKEFDLAVN